MDTRESVARAICMACEEKPDAPGDARGNEWRWQDYADVADSAIAVMEDEIRRLRDLLSAAKWPEAPDDRRAAQAEGKHPSPCARFCEANAFEIELRQVRNDNKRLRAAMQQTLDENVHLADGENCTLIVLKRALMGHNE